ncbi:MAG: DUF1559 domain-containing protein [Pirellulaceae bacterium]
MVFQNNNRARWQPRTLLPPLMALLMAILISLAGCTNQESSDNSNSNSNDDAIAANDNGTDKKAPAALDVAYVPATAIAAIVVAPEQILSAESVQLYPIEVLEALSQKTLGINVKDIKQALGVVTVSAESPIPQAGLIVRLSKPCQLDDLFPLLKAAGILKKEQKDGQTFVRIKEQSPSPVTISYTMPDDKTVLLGMNGYASQMLAAKDADSPLIKLLKQSDANHQAIAIVSADMIPEQFKAMATNPELIPPMLAPYVGALKQLAAVEINIDLGQQLAGELVIHAHDVEEAKKLEQVIQQGLELGKQMFLAQASQIDSGDALIDSAMQKYMVRIADFLGQSFQPTRDGNRLTLDSDATVGLASTGVMVALLLPAVQAARTAARKMSSANNLKQIGIALHNYHETYKQLPVGESPGIKYKDGKQLLSWRVHILPFVEQESLYTQFHLDEPWDSPHNIQLLDSIPPVYVSPLHPLENRTVYVAPMGPNTVLGSGKRVRFADVLDGLSQVIAVIEAGSEQAVPWTRPDDLPIDSRNPIGSIAPDRDTFQVLFADGSVHSLRPSISTETLNRLIEMNDGKPLGNFYEDGVEDAVPTATTSEDPFTEPEP